MTGEEMVSRMQAEGFDYLTTGQCIEFLNDAYLLDICDIQDWPFLEASTSGTAPLTISDLRSIESVSSTTQEVKLRPMDRRNITDRSYNLEEAGTPRYYYLSGETQVKVFPVATDTISVRYYKNPTKLSTSSTPLLPERFHSVIVDGAVARAYENSDDFELRQSKEATFQARLARMEGVLLDVYRDGPSQFIQVTDPFALS